MPVSETDREMNVLPANGVSVRPGRLPPPLRPGARVGVAALSGPVDPGSLEAGMEAVRRLGFEPLAAHNVLRCQGLFAGGDEERLAAFHQLIADDRVEAIFFARGGHGLLRLLPSIDWELLGRRPRTFLGYSDLTPLLLEIHRRFGWVSFHGPMVAKDLARPLGSEESDSLMAALTGDWPQARSVEMLGGPEPSPAEPIDGVLLGGCLSLLTATLGTPFAPRFGPGSMIFLEDVGEPHYRLDRMLTHLYLSGSLTDARALLSGYSSPPEDLIEVGSGSGSDGWRESLRDVAAKVGCWVADGLLSGHGVPNHVLPIGLEARLEPAKSRLILGPEGQGMSATW